MRIGFYAGSFDPLTKGHEDIILRSLKLVDQMVIGIGVSASKKPLFSVAERQEIIHDAIAAHGAELAERINIVEFSGLLVDAARTHQATLIIRGLRSVTDYDYEAEMTAMNAAMAPDVETVFLMASPATRFISSTLVRQIASMKGSFSDFVSASVADRLRQKFQD